MHGKTEPVYSNLSGKKSLAVQICMERVKLAEKICMGKVDMAILICMESSNSGPARWKFPTNAGKIITHS